MTMNSNGHVDSTVCLNGDAIKRFREDQKLTQLYVSKVVGVTTDTVSRWENNRYPTIRRENALKLAEALAVPLDEILLSPAAEEQSDLEESRKPSPYLWVGMALLVLVLVVAVTTMKTEQPPPVASVTAERVLSDFAAPGAPIPVQVRLVHHNGSSGFILREYFPRGWKLLQAHPPASSLDNVNGVARWIIKAGDQRDRIVYLVQVDATADPAAPGGFRGEVIVDNKGKQLTIPVTGEEKVQVAPVHWADNNGDGKIDDGEMLQASYTIDDMEGVLIDWNALERLWDAGRYQWDKEKGTFVPVPKAEAVPSGRVN